jgi:Protein of unknown function (DUF669)
MSFAFKIPTDEQLEEVKTEYKLLTPGEYDFEVISAENTISKSSNNMIKLTLKVWEESGKERTIFDYLVNMSSMWWKIRHFADSVSLSSAFSAEDCVGKCGKAIIVIQPGKPNLMTGEKYPDKNTVKDYIISKSSPTFVENDEQLPEWMK